MSTRRGAGARFPVQAFWGGAPGSYACWGRKAGVPNSRGLISPGGLSAQLPTIPDAVPTLLISPQNPAVFPIDAIVVAIGTHDVKGAPLMLSGIDNSSFRRNIAILIDEDLCASDNTSVGESRPLITRQLLTRQLWRIRPFLPRRSGLPRRL
jgi:hypothetical protein